MPTSNKPSSIAPSLDNLTTRLIDFRDARDWKQFHSLKDLILSLNLEASELLELTQWKSGDEFEALANDPTMQAKLKEETADVLLYLLLVCERAGIDLLAAADEKINRNEERYPVEKAKGTAKKYDEL